MNEGQSRHGREAKAPRATALGSVLSRRDGGVLSLSLSFSSFSMAVFVSLFFVLVLADSNLEK